MRPTDKGNTMYENNKKKLTWRIQDKTASKWETKKHKPNQEDVERKSDLADMDDNL